jgi:hypothetical protein
MVRERRALQVCVAIGALVPLSAGFAGAVAGGALTGDVLSASGDSHMRYLSGLLLAMGLGFWTTIPAIEHKTDRFRLLTLIVLTGGVFRVAALRDGPWPSPFMLGGAMMEVIVTPLLCFWQTRIASMLGPSVGAPQRGR